MEQGGDGVQAGYHTHVIRVAASIYPPVLALRGLLQPQPNQWTGGEEVVCVLFSIVPLRGCSKIPSFLPYPKWLLTLPAVTLIDGGMTGHS